MFLIPSFRSSLLGIVIILVISACKSDDALDLIPNDKKVSPGTPQSITCKINGQEFSSKFPLAAGTFSTSGDIYTIGIGGIDFFEKDTVGVALGIHGSDFSTLANSNVFTGTGLITRDFGFGAITIHGKEVVEDATSVETKIAKITITKIDRDKKIVSGTFSYEALDPDSGSTFVVSDGVFSEIEYD